jgi:outer membrane protein assembly factor BamB
MNEIAIVGVVSLAIVACVTAPGGAEDWPMWRGPRGDGTSIEQEVPSRWSATDNIAWKVKTPGVGHASPIVFGNHVFLVTCTGTP